MSYLEWSDDFSLNNETIDTQHKKVIGMINGLHDSINKGDGRNKIGDLIQEMIDYTSVHFREEENFMQEIGYPDLDRHKEIHNNLINRVQDINNRIKSGELNICWEVFLFLNDWWEVHILKTDKKILKYSISG